jgi:hypothetical protein
VSEQKIVRRVGDRVVVYNHRGERQGKGTVVETQLYAGEYVRVKMDGGDGDWPAGAKPAFRQDMTKRLVKKSKR